MNMNMKFVHNFILFAYSIAISWSQPSDKLMTENLSADQAQTRDDSRERLQEQRINRQAGERSARYKAEQKRLNEMRAKREEIELKRKRQMDKSQSRKFQHDSELSKTYSVKRMQSQQVNNLYSQIDNHAGLQGAIVEVKDETADFIIQTSTQQQFFIRFTLYVQENNAYGFIRNVSAAKPMQIIVIKDQTQIIVQTTFYFQAFIQFSTKPGSRFTVKLINEGMPKLTVMAYPNYLQASHADKMYDTESGMKQLKLAQIIVNRIKLSLTDLQREKLMVSLNHSVLNMRIKLYLDYQIFEMALVALLSLFQLKLIQNMFRKTIVV